VTPLTKPVKRTIRMEVSNGRQEDWVITVWPHHIEYRRLHCRTVYRVPHESCFWTAVKHMRLDRAQKEA